MSALSRALRSIDERAVLEATELTRLRQPVTAPGMYALLEETPGDDAATYLARLQARTAGPVRPDHNHGRSTDPVQLCRVADVVHLPSYGAMVWADGSAPMAPLSGAITDPARLAAAPGFTRTPGGFAFRPPDDAPELAGAGVFMPWGGGFNYGHFLLDALPSLLALEETGLAAELAPIAPPLKPWQRQLIALLDGPAVREIAAPVVRLRQAAYASSINHFLHAPNALLGRVRDRLGARAGPSPVQADRIYLSRRSHAHPMRILLNEVELERALTARGFVIVRPERLRPAQQIALCRQAKVVIGPSGAGMANALFAPPGALVIDIQPQVFPGAWVQAFGHLVGHDSWVYCAPAPVAEAEVPWVRRARRGFRFGYRLPLDDFLAFLDDQLARA